MAYETGICEACGRRTAALATHAQWCRPAAPLERTCRDCGAWLSDVRRQRCLDCEVNHAFDALSEQTKARRLAAGGRVEGGSGGNK